MLEDCRLREPYDTWAGSYRVCSWVSRCIPTSISPGQCQCGADMHSWSARKWSGVMAVNQPCMHSQHCDICVVDTSRGFYLTPVSWWGRKISSQQIEILASCIDQNGCSCIREGCGSSALSVLERVVSSDVLCALLSTSKPRSRCRSTESLFEVT